MHQILSLTNWGLKLPFQDQVKDIDQSGHDIDTYQDTFGNTNMDDNFVNDTLPESKRPF